jgi:hypothetical protein
MISLLRKNRRTSASRFSMKTFPSTRTLFSCGNLHPCRTRASIQLSSLHSTILGTWAQEALGIKPLMASFVSECAEVGLGSAANKQGKRIGEDTAGAILDLFKGIPDVKRTGLGHVEEIQLYVDQISKDRISDITCSLLKSFLIDFTMDQCTRWQIPTEAVSILSGAYAEMQVLAKKSPNDAVNQFKLGLLNGLLTRINRLIDEDGRPIDGFELFDKTAVPTVSDVLFVLSQYSETLEHIRSANITNYAGQWFWVIDGERSATRTAAPKKLTT